LTFSTEDFAKALEQQDFDFQRGTIVHGKVFSHTAEGAYVDIGGKSAAFLPLKEAMIALDVSLEEALPLETDREFMIIRDQDANGQVILSIRRLEIQQVWERLAEQQENNDVLDVMVTGTNKGGVIAEVEGLRGFIPRSHLVGAGEDLESFVGQTLTVAFLEVNAENNKLVLSQRIAARNTAMTQLSEGQLIEGTVAALKPFGVFVDFQGVRGLLHINQISKSYVPAVGELFQVGQPIKAVIVNIDDARQRIGLSTKVLEKYPGELLKDAATVMAEAETRAEDVSKLLAERDA
jgi:small subunit ribosomal protein S1